MKIQSLALVFSISPFVLFGADLTTKTQDDSAPSGAAGKTGAVSRATASGADKEKEFFQEVHFTSAKDEQCIAKLILELLEKEEEGVDIVTDQFDVNAFTSCAVPRNEHKKSYSEWVGAINDVRDKRGKPKLAINVIVNAQQMYDQHKTEQEKYTALTQDRTTLLGHGVSYAAQPFEKEAKGGSLHRFMLFRNNRYAEKDAAGPLVLLGMWCFDQAAIQGQRADIVVVTDDELKIKAHTDELHYAMNFTSQKGRIQDNLLPQFSEANWQVLERLNGLLDSENDISWSHTSVCGIIAELIKNEKRGFRIVLPHTHWLTIKEIFEALHKLEPAIKKCSSITYSECQDSKGIDETVVLERAQELTRSGLLVEKVFSQTLGVCPMLLFLKNSFAAAQNPLLLLGGGSFLLESRDNTRSAVTGCNLSGASPDRFLEYIDSDKELLKMSACKIQLREDVFFDMELCNIIKCFIIGELKRVDMVMYSFNLRDFQEHFIANESESDNAGVPVRILVYSPNASSPVQYPGSISVDGGTKHHYEVQVTYVLPREKLTTPSFKEGIHHKYILCHENKALTKKDKGEQFVMTGSWHPKELSMFDFATGMVVTNDPHKVRAYRRETEYIHNSDNDYQVAQVPSLQEEYMEQLAKKAGTKAYHVFFNRKLPKATTSNFIVQLIANTKGAIKIVMERFSLSNITTALTSNSQYIKKLSYILTNEPTEKSEETALNKVVCAGVPVHTWTRKQAKSNPVASTMLVIKAILFSDVRQSSEKDQVSPLLIIGSMNLTPTCENEREDNMALFRSPKLCRKFDAHIETLKKKCNRQPPEQCSSQTTLNPAGSKS